MENPVGHPMELKIGQAITSIATGGILLVQLILKDE